MKAFFDELHDNYDILNLSYEEVVELNNVFDSCKLPQKRFFHELKRDIEKFVAMKRLPKKK
jgi:hypothetical protein